jgi:muramoyltetrapeptide carboxypeptidase
VGVAALSGPVDPDRLDAGLAALAGLGLTPVLADNVRSRHGFFAGSDAERLAAFHRLAADPDLPAIFFARGGWGALRLLPALDWGLLAARPRAWVGYSDVTPFLLAVVRRLGLAAFHGPMVATDFARGLSAAESESLLAALAGRYPVAEPVAGWQRPAAARGQLLGGCLSLLTAVLGTPFASDLSGAVLFLEEIDEPAYRLDRMLTHLRLSGNLDTIQAMIFGHLTLLGSPEVAATAAPRLMSESLQDFAWPMVWGVASGHGIPNRTLPLGLQARLAPESDAVVLGED